MVEESCAVCRFWWAAEQSCRYGPPQVAAVAHPPKAVPQLVGIAPQMNMQVQVMAIWPKTNPDGWCGKWEATEVATND